jgi:hypothetical protein
MPKLWKIEAKRTKLIKNFLGVMQTKLLLKSVVSKPRSKKATVETQDPVV